jgi:hypothetical protein
VHLNRLRAERLIKVVVQGRHRYYSLDGPHVARALEALSVLAFGPGAAFVPSTPTALRAARTCYDHLAGTLGVALHDALHSLGWINATAADTGIYDVTPSGEIAFGSLGVDVEAARALRRRFAYPCLDWSERRPHLGGARRGSQGGSGVDGARVDSRALRYCGSTRRSRLGIALKS